MANNIKNFKALQRSLIIKNLGITDEEYSMYLFDFGVETAEFQVGKNQAIFRTQTSSYWHWFENQFAIADELFLNDVKDVSASLHNLLNFWKQYHSPERLVSFPTKEVYRDEIALVFQSKHKAK